MTLSVPPFANENIETLQSIFEVSHLRPSVLFLDTQCELPQALYKSKIINIDSDRMPPFIGDHISKSVYDGKLASNPDHPVKNKTISCYFIDVVAGKQKSEGTSLKVK